MVRVCIGDNIIIKKITVLNLALIIIVVVDNHLLAQILT